MLTRTILGMVTLAADSVGREAWGPERSTPAANAVRDLIAERLESSTLGSAMLCRHLAISRTSLYRLFERDGGVQAYIRDRRLDAVRVALCDADSRDTIAMLADRYKFSDSAHLTRSFRLRFGTTPGAYRRDCLKFRIT
jgi:AraC-like DNA-binding protein